MASRINKRKRPIGVFDSGLGGLTVVRHLARLLPSEDLIYLGDLAHLPYGTKSDRQIRRYSEKAAAFLSRFRIKMLVVACNSASAIAFPALKRKFSVPMVGVIAPSVEEAARLTRTGRVGVIGTEATIRSGAYPAVMRMQGRGVRVSTKACPLFVSLVEAGWTNGTVTSEIARRYLGGFKKRGVDTLILGCTHYPLLASTISRVLGRRVRLVGSGESAARQVRKILGERGILRDRGRKGKIRCFMTDAPERFQSLGRRFLGRRIQKRVYSLKEVRLDV